MFAVIERFMAVGDAEKKRKLLRFGFEKEFKNFEMGETYKSRIYVLIKNGRKNENSSPLVIEKIETHKQWIQSIIIQFFQKKNLVSLEPLRQKKMTNI